MRKSALVAVVSARERLGKRTSRSITTFWATRSLGVPINYFEFDPDRPAEVVVGGVVQFLTGFPHIDWMTKPVPGLVLIDYQAINRFTFLEYAIDNRRPLTPRTDNPERSARPRSP